MREFELVLPCYNESLSLERLIKRTREAAEASGFTPDTFQLVLVENGSSDNSKAVLEGLKAGELGPWFRVVEVEKNDGYGFGLWAGLKTATAKYVAWSHADEQCDPHDAFKALARLRSSESREATLIKGVRRGRSAKERLVSRVFEFFAKAILGLKVYEINAQPKVFPRALLANCTSPPKTFAFDLYILYQAKKLGFTIETIAVDFLPRVHGFSRWAHGVFRRYKTILQMIEYMWQLKEREGRL